MNKMAKRASDTSDSMDTKLDGGAKPDHGFGLKSRVVIASLTTILLLVAGGTWAATAKLSGAIIASGMVVVQKHVKKVQHRDGGIVAQINVKNGDVVKKNDVLIELDDTQTKAELGIIHSQLVELLGRKARLTTERDNQTDIIFPFEAKDAGPDINRVIIGEKRLLQNNRRTRKSKKQQLFLRIEQLNEEISGLTSQMNAKSGELRLIKKELKDIKRLYRKKLTAASRVYAMEREATRIRGDHGGLVAQIARIKGQISEVNIQILSVDHDAQTLAQREIRSIEAKVAELSERQVAVSDKLRRIKIRAPLSGVVHELTAHTINGVISPAEPIMLIVPQNDDLTIEARISPTDIDQISIDQHVKLRFSAFNQRTTPELPSKLQQISADVTRDRNTGQSYYIARIAIDEKALNELGRQKLVPGMPVEVFITTQERSALSFFAKPFTDQFERAFREE
ncbi:MAG: HlyD family type I secretion periplasmic adaptor subunit [Hyphomicrobiaceae bacterium]|nr:HlyD family type I secretion periplasmic adaptor subunit [Hyphomicrobiaceae bacterium]